MSAIQTAVWKRLEITWYEAIGPDGGSETPRSVRNSDTRKEGKMQIPMKIKVTIKESDNDRTFDVEIWRVRFGATEPVDEYYRTRINEAQLYEMSTLDRVQRVMCIDFEKFHILLPNIRSDVMRESVPLTSDQLRLIVHMVNIIRHAEDYDASIWSKHKGMEAYIDPEQGGKIVTNPI